MNETEQKNHKTAITKLSQDMAAMENRLTEAGDEALKTLEVDLLRTIETGRNQDETTLGIKLGTMKQDIMTDVYKLCNRETTARNRLANEQRHYVDAQDNALKNYINDLRNRGFWGRLNWLLRGK